MTNPKIIKIPEGPRNKALSYDGGVNVGQKAGANRGGRFSHSFNRTPYAPTGSGGGNNYKSGGGKISKYYSAGGTVITGRD